MKVQAGLFPVKFAVVEDPLDLALEVGNDVLVLHVEHFAGQNVVPVVHEALILKVVFPEFDHIVGKGLSRRE